MRGVQTFTTILLLIYVVRHSFLYFNFMKEKRRVLKESKFIMSSLMPLVGFWQSKYSKIMALEIVICLIHNPPIVDGILNVS